MPARIFDAAFAPFWILGLGIKKPLPSFQCLGWCPGKFRGSIGPAFWVGGRVTHAVLQSPKFRSALSFVECSAVLKPLIFEQGGSVFLFCIGLYKFCSRSRCSINICGKISDLPIEFRNLNFTSESIGLIVGLSFSLSEV